MALGGRGGTAQLRVLDAGSEALARTDPAVFRAGGEILSASGDAFHLSLEPYAYARLELA